jgi:hypothetical protein
MRDAHDSRDLYEARWVRDGFLTGGQVEVSLPDSSKAVLTRPNSFVLYPGAISTAIADYTVERSRMRSGGRDVVRYVPGGIYRNMRATHFSDLEGGREYFLCWQPEGGWFWLNNLIKLVREFPVLMENGREVGRYHDDARGAALELVAGISLPVALLILWIGLVANFFGEEDFPRSS